LGHDLIVLMSLSLMSAHRSILAPICSCLMSGKIKPILHDFQVQNVIFPDCLTMHALEFCTKHYGCFSFVCLFVLFISKKCMLFIICLVF